MSTDLKSLITSFKSLAALQSQVNHQLGEVDVAIQAMAAAAAAEPVPAVASVLPVTQPPPLVPAQDTASHISRVSVAPTPSSTSYKQDWTEALSRVSHASSLSKPQRTNPTV